LIAVGDFIIKDFGDYFSIDGDRELSSSICLYDEAKG
jgi:hypothetical protein